MSKLIVSNWKAHPASAEEAVELAKATDYENFIICPPFKFLTDVALVLKKAKLGAQDFTSEEELKKMGVSYVIVGHSDRRKAGETNEMIAEKVAQVLNAGMMPILCVGENLEEKRAGQKEKVILEQVNIGLSLVGSRPIFIAYEPVWAISTSGSNEGPDKPENTLEVIKIINKKKINFF